MNSFRTILTAIIFIFAFQLQAQKALVSKDNETTFFSKAPLENITAKNGQTTAAIDLTKKELVVKMLIKHFDFKNSLMQEHFNENYMESDKFPSAVFTGTLISDEDLDVNNKGKFPVKVKGTMKIHGIEQPFESDAIIEVLEYQIRASADFILKPADFEIKIPKMVVKNIAENIEVSTALTFEK